MTFMFKTSRRVSGVLHSSRGFARERTTAQSDPATIVEQRRDESDWRTVQHNLDDNISSDTLNRSSVIERLYGAPETLRRNKFVRYCRRCTDRDTSLFDALTFWCRQIIYSTRRDQCANDCARGCCHRICYPGETIFPLPWDCE